MSEHAFDPMPDEQQEALRLVHDEEVPNAVVTAAQVTAALASGVWSHEVPGITLWLNTSFPIHDHTEDSLVLALTLHGIVIQ